MDSEAIPGLSDDLNTEIHSINEEFFGHQNERKDVDDDGDGARASVELHRSVEDREEEAIARECFDGSPYCALGPEKGFCWIHAGERNSCKLGRRAWS